MLAVVLATAPSTASSQPAPAPAAEDEAHALWTAAAAHRSRRDDGLVAYTAVVRQRVAAGLRMPLRDRTLYRAEAAHRVFWDREGDVLVQVLALREQTPMGVQEGVTHSGMFDRNFDPLDDRLLFGLVEPDEDGRRDPDGFWFEHPLDPTWSAGYRFEVGDTLTLGLGGGRELRAVELRVTPTEADVHRMSGSLWIEPGSGALVRAVYRLSDTFDAMRDVEELRDEEAEGSFRFVPGLFKPWTAEVRLIAVDYARWDDVWLPRSLRAEGTVSAGILSAPATVEMSYEVEAVTTRAERDAEEAAAPGAAAPGERVFGSRDEALAELARLTTGTVPYRLDPGHTRTERGSGRRRVHYLVPEDPAWLRESPELPEPVGADDPDFLDAAEVEELVGRLDDLPDAPLPGIPWTFRWGPQRPELLRYNRVEGLSVGARAQLRPSSPWGPLSVSATARLGSTDREPNLRLGVERETLRRRVTVSVFHELAPVDEGARHLGPGNSLTAALFGRDDGEYYRRSGVGLAWRPPVAERQRFEVRAYAEHHRPVDAAAGFALWNVADEGWAFRDNVRADEGWEVGGLVRLAPWWGSDPRRLQGGVAWLLQAAGGDHRYARSSVEGTLAVPVAGDVRAALEVAAGTSWGAPPVQRLWYLGGSTTLRGYGPSIRVGPDFGRARAEVALQRAFGAVALFADAGWAGEFDAFGTDAVLPSAGVGLSFVDGLIRLDGAWALRAPRGFRLEFYLDGIL